MLRRKKINPISKKQRAKKPKWNDLVEYLIKNRACGYCEVCHELPDWRGLQGHHIKARSQGGGDLPGNCLITCGRCHSMDGHHIREANVAKDILQTDLEQRFLLKRDGWDKVRRNQLQCKICQFKDIVKTCTLGVLPKMKCAWYRKEKDNAGT